MNTTGYIEGANLYVSRVLCPGPYVCQVLRFYVSYVLCISGPECRGFCGSHILSVPNPMSWVLCIPGPKYPGSFMSRVLSQFLCSQALCVSGAMCLGSCVSGFMRLGFYVFRVLCVSGPFVPSSMCPVSVYQVLIVPGFTLYVPQALCVRD